MLIRGGSRNVGCHVHKLSARLHLWVSALRSSATAAAPLHDQNNQTPITPPPEPQNETPLPRSLLSFKVPTTLIFRALSKVRSLELTCAKHTLVKVRKSKRLTHTREDGLTQPHQRSSLSFARVPVWALCAMSSRQASSLGRARTCLTCQIMTLLARRMSIDRRAQKW